MRSVVVTVPPIAAVTAAEAKAAGVFKADDVDAFVSTLLAAAQGTIDGPDGWLGRAVGLQTLELSRPAFCMSPGGAVISLPLPPIAEIVSIKYDDADGVEQTVDPDSYALVGDVVAPRRGSYWPSPAPGLASVRITYTAGWAADKVPAPIKHAIMLMAAKLKTVAPSAGVVRREEVTGVGAKDYSAPDLVTQAMDSAAQALLAGYKVYRV